MSTQHIVHKILEPGLAGDGFTAAEAAAVRSDLDNIAPSNAGTAGDQLRVTAGGDRRWLPPDTVSPLLFGAAGDGTTNDYAAFMQAVDSLGADGGSLNLSGKRYRLNDSLTFAAHKAVSIDGGANNSSGSTYDGGGTLLFPDGIDGLVFETRTHPHLTNLAVRVAGVVAPRSSGTGHGIVVRTVKANFNNVRVTGFGGNGFHVVSAPVDEGVNANLGHMNQCDASYNGGHGMYFKSADSNAWSVVSPNLIFNAGYGIYNDALYHNTFIVPHAYGNTEGDFFDNAWSSMWLNPYSEHAGDFDIGSSSDRCVLIMGGNAAPNVNYRATGTGTKHRFNNDSSGNSTATGRVGVNSRNWYIICDGELWTALRMRLHTGDSEFAFVPERTGPGGMEISRDDSPYMRFGGTGADRQLRVTASHLGFFDAIPTTKRTVTGSKGGNAALGSLITALANLGLITDSTS